jgi:hypothetical protein
MLRQGHRFGSLWLLVALVAWLGGACTPASPAATAPAGRTPPVEVPHIRAVEADRLEVPRYEKLELAVTLEASYDNPYDVRQVDLTAVFGDPGGHQWSVPGFWDGEKTWRVRFTPSVEGAWRYSLQVRDRRGPSAPWTGEFTCLPSAHHGWLQVGNWVNPAYSPRYLAYHDGAPFYGVGHADAINLMSYGFDAEKGFSLFNQMAEYGENMLVYWPIYSNPFFATRYDHYSVPDLKVIDMIVEDAARKGIFLVFTIWDHGMLRDKTHAWGNGLWETQNGFRELGSLESFFTGVEAWAWQEALYRYIIARWGYSPAIGQWLTVSEIEGTNAGPHTDEWHQRVNDYFVRHDPFRHPTTASMAGDAWWPAGYQVMDVTQMHSYNSQNDPAGTGPLIADWTHKLWQAQAKPNFIGEFGTTTQRNQPELLHNGIWAALAAGAAATPMDWNDNGPWGRMTDELGAHLGYLAKFVADMPLVYLNPRPLTLTTSGQGLRAWGLGGADWGFFWVQAVAPAGAAVEQVSGATVAVEGLSPGTYAVRPYDTWRGLYLAESQAAVENGRLIIALPAFERDLAVKMERKS